METFQKVRVANARIAKNKKGEEFVALDLVQIMLVMGKKSGEHYLGTKKCSITSSLNPEIAKSLVGETLPGKITTKDIVLEEGQSYPTWKNPSTGDVVEIKTRNIYSPAE